MTSALVRAYVERRMAHVTAQLADCRAATAYLLSPVADTTMGQAEAHRQLLAVRRAQERLESRLQHWQQKLDLAPTWIVP